MQMQDKCKTFKHLLHARVFVKVLVVVLNSPLASVTKGTGGVPSVGLLPPREKAAQLI